MSGGWKMFRIWERRWGSETYSGKILADIVLIGSELTVYIFICEKEIGDEQHDTLWRMKFDISGIYLSRDLMYDYLIQTIGDYPIKPRNATEIIWRNNDWELDMV